MLHRVEGFGGFDLVPVVADLVDSVEIFEPPSCRLALADFLEFLLDVAESLLGHDGVVALVGRHRGVDRVVFGQHAPR